MGKIVDKEYYKTKIKPRLREEGKTVALCHGVFDLVHPGHILHFEQAKAMADVLVVSVTAAKFVRKGPGRPYFDDNMRLKFLSALSDIDYVMLSDGYTVDDIVEAVEPDFYVKGSEYADESADITGNIAPERELVEKHGGELRFTGGQVFSSTKLINNNLAGLTDEVCAYMRNFKTRYGSEDLLKWEEKANRLKVLVVGEVIIDKYTYCFVNGLMSKDMGYSARLEKSEEYLGGAAAIARHLANFTDDVTLMSVMGDDEKSKIFKENMPEAVCLEIERTKKIPTIVKHRYLQKGGKRDEYRKIFAINNISDDMSLDNTAKTNFYNRLRETIDKYDAVFLSDFGHGLFDEEVMKVIENNAKFLILNCQSNSSNFGLNPITKYHKADMFVLDEKELKLAFPSLAGQDEKALQSLSKHLKGNGCLTKGANGAISIDGDKIRSCPAFTLQVRDTVGAGDAFYAVAGIYAAAGAPVELSMFMGNVAGALGANIVGNKDSVEKVNALKYASTLMNV